MLPLHAAVFWLGALLLPASSGSPSIAEDPIVTAFSRLQVKNLMPHVQFLTSEECGGRDTPSPGLERAAGYIADRYKETALEPGGDEGSFFRYWEWSDPGTAPDAFLRMESSEGTKSFAPGEDFEVVEGSPTLEVSGEPMFLGYGIDAGKYRYSDFVKADVRGKVLLVFSHEPREKEKGNSFEGLEATRHSSVFQKSKEAAKAGAAAILVVTDPKNHKETGPIALNMRRRARLGIEPYSEKLEIPTFFLSLAAAEAILDKKLLPIQESIDRSLSSQFFSVSGKKIVLKSAIEEKREKIKNVVAFRKGSDPELSREVVVIGAHFDHVGTDERGVIWPGADDNASGTAALVEIAKAFASVPTPRTILVVHFSEEEVGLLGSKEFVLKPTFPVDSMVAMLNADMIGRGKRDEVAVQGLKFCPGMAPFLTKAERRKSLPIRTVPDLSEKFFERSDQVHFYKAGIPVLFFMGVANEHEDYHRTTDTVDKIDAVKLQNTTRLLFLVAYQLATDKNKPEKPNLSKEGRTR